MRELLAVPTCMLAFSLPACDSAEIEKSLTLGQAVAVLRELVDLASWWNDGTCPLGGEVEIVHSDSRREVADTVWESGRWAVIPDGCEIAALGDTLVLKGDPSVIVESLLRYVNVFENGEYDMKATGGVTWQRGDSDSGTCEVDVAVEDAEVNLGGAAIDGISGGTPLRV